MKLLSRAVVSIVVGAVIGFIFYGISFGSCFGYPKSDWCEYGESASILLPLAGTILVFLLLTIRNKNNRG